MVVVGGRLYSVSENSQAPTLIHTFDTTPVWDRIVGDKEGKDDQEIERAIKDLNDGCFWAFLSPDESFVCFYATKEYIAVFDVKSHDLRWCYRLKGHSADEYWANKPIFHPTKPMMAWVEQFGKNDDENFSSLKDCGVCISDVSKLDSIPIRLEGFTGKDIKLLCL